MAIAENNNSTALTPNPDNGLVTPNEELPFELEGWSERQKRVFLADRMNNIVTGRLRNLKEGDKCIKAFPSLLGRIDYRQVSVSSHTNGYIETGNPNVEALRGRFSDVDGVDELGPDIGWLILEDPTLQELGPGEQTKLLSGE